MGRCDYDNPMEESSCKCKKFKPKQLSGDDLNVNMEINNYENVNTGDDEK